MFVGGELIISGNYTGGDVFNVLFAVLIGGMALGQVSPNVAAFAAGKAAAAQMFKVGTNPPASTTTQVTCSECCFLVRTFFPMGSFLTTRADQAALGSL